MKKYLTPAVLAASLFGASDAVAAPVLQQGDFAIAIDQDITTIMSSTPPAETALNAVDQSPAKYLNFGRENSGIIVTPFFGPAAAQSMVLTTANDFAGRDPASWIIWGTNDPIDHVAANHGTGEIPGVTWTQLGSGDVALPGTLPGGGQADPNNNGRNEVGPTLSFANATAYNSYKIIFPTVKDNTLGTTDSMQIGEIELYPTLDGPLSSSNILSIFDSDVTRISAIGQSRTTFQSATPAAEVVANVLDGRGPRYDLAAQSGYPAGENPTFLIDGTNGKYLNNGGSGSGFIVTPAVGASTVRSFQLTTANDAVGRDPVSYELYGTNDAIISADNSHGTAETWTLISSGALALPTDRNMLGPVVSVSNEASFTSYKMVFPQVVGANLLQLAEASFYSTPDAMGADILNVGDPIRAIGSVMGIETKYLNFGEERSGLIVTPQVGAKVVTGLQITTANDAPARDPASYEIYGTNDDITSAPNSQGEEENWTLIASGALSLPEARFTDGEIVTFANTTAYESYKIVFPTVKDAAGTNSMQIAGIQLFDSAVAADPDFDGDGDVDGRDLLVWQRNLGAAGQVNNSNGDADGNGVVNGDDLTVWRSAFGPSATAAAGAIPEPAGVAMALAGAAIAWGAGRGRKHD